MRIIKHVNQLQVGQWWPGKILEGANWIQDLRGKCSVKMREIALLRSGKLLILLYNILMWRLLFKNIENICGKGLIWSYPYRKKCLNSPNIILLDVKFPFIAFSEMQNRAQPPNLCCIILIFLIIPAPHPIPPLKHLQSSIILNTPYIYIYTRLKLLF